MSPAEPHQSRLQPSPDPKNGSLSVQDKVVVGQKGHKTDEGEDSNAPDTSGLQLIPLKERPVWARWDVGPFVLLYALLMALDAQYSSQYNSTTPSPPAASSDSMVSIPFVMTLLWICTLIGQVTMVLGSQWNVAWKAAIGYQRAPRRFYPDHNTAPTILSQWTHCLVLQTTTSSSYDNNNEKKKKTTTTTALGLVPVVYKKDQAVAVATFQDQVFRCTADDDSTASSALSPNWPSGSVPDQDPSTTVIVLQNEEEKILTFRPRSYPDRWPLPRYASWPGHMNPDQVLRVGQIYGPNTTCLQIPSWWELLAEQLIAPFFLFQILCVVLWSLDEYWYYSIFTLMALLMFESTLAYQRRTSLQRLHRAGHDGDLRVYVRRGTQVVATHNRNNPADLTWMAIPSRELLPGDWVSLSSTQQAIPADILLLRGTAVVDEALLTGESIPQLKHALDIAESTGAAMTAAGPPRLDLQDSQHKESILFGGTILLVSNYADSSTDADTARALSDEPPDRGVVGMVLRTGFETAQGNLLRTMAHSQKSSDGIHTWDTFVFIFLLILCAVAAAAWVLHEGWHDDRRNQFRLLLHVVIIITSVVPPELPMELSLAVTNSVAALIRRCQVYCTEHFRIPLAGEVTVCCFDKTGTLTSDEMRLRGVRVFVTSNTLTTSSSKEDQEHDDLLLMPGQDSIPWSVLRIMAACHSLAPATARRGARPGKSSTMIGDPLEQAVLKETGFRLIGNDMVAPLNDESQSAPSLESKAISILHRFAFSSKLKRMTVLVTEEGGQGKVWALCKGAPEILKQLLTAESTPSNYDEVSFYHMARGRRVLAMAYREAGTTRQLVALKEAGRQAIEAGFTFAGFLVLDCPLKPDSKSVVTELQRSGHKVVMITGDAMLTAAEVARQVGITRTNKERTTMVYEIVVRENPDVVDSLDPLSGFECVPIAGKRYEGKPFILSSKSMSTMIEQYKAGDASFCVSGNVLVKLAESALTSATKEPVTSTDEKSILLSSSAQSLLKSVVPAISVFARHAPHHKEAVVAAFNHSGEHTLMCGDGTNDVGALKRAHVGISIISAPEIESKHREATSRLVKARAEQKKMTSKKKAKRAHNSSVEESLRQLREAQDELEFVELGDASVAAPFTSRAVSIKCCKDVIQQGRCTLVTMLQIYKILGINCLVNAMVLSRLYLRGVKHGDRQLTILGVGVAAFFFFVTRSEPMPTLSTLRPPSSVLCYQAFLSILGQFIIHVGLIFFTTETALSFVDPYDPSLMPDGPFNANVLNSCTFMLTCIATVNTFAVNYRGRPFMQDLHENKMLFRTLLLSYAILITAALELFPPLNDMLELATFPSTVDLPFLREEKPEFSIWLLRQIGFPGFLSGIIVVDTVLTYLWEKKVVLPLHKKSP